MPRDPCADAIGRDQDRELVIGVGKLHDVVAESVRPEADSASDVDGVLLDPDRNGNGHWTNELTARFGIERMQLRDAFFMRSRDDVINGRRSAEDGLSEALTVAHLDQAVLEALAPEHR